MFEKTIWKPWQFRLIQEVQRKPDDRKIIWYYDDEGNKGKTFLCEYLRSKGAKVLMNGKTADIAYIYNGEKIVLFDYTRSMETYVNYGLLEGIKNGYLVSTKYMGCTKSFEKPHVIVMANFRPDYNKLSLDRWDVRIITPERST